MLPDHNLEKDKNLEKSLENTQNNEKIPKLRSLFLLSKLHRQIGLCESLEDMCSMTNVND